MYENIKIHKYGNIKKYVEKYECKRYKRGCIKKVNIYIYIYI